MNINDLLKEFQIKKTREVGRMFDYYDGVKKCKEVTLVTVYSEGVFCDGCYFSDTRGRCTRVTKFTGFCSIKMRSDGVSVIFVEVVKNERR